MALLPTNQKIKTEPTSTVAAPKQQEDQSENSTFTIQLGDLPDFGNVDLFQMDPNDEKDLIAALTQTKKQIENQQTSKTTKQNMNEQNTENNPPQANKENITQNPQAIVPSVNTVNTFQQQQIPVLPRMFFSNSNVTINYNFGK